jgi:hypothetical protein
MIEAAMFVAGFVCGFAAFTVLMFWLIRRGWR